MPYVPGRTFRNPQERGDYDTEGRAVLSDDQLALIFIRYIVDVYHQTKHSGLFGETPEDAMKRLGGTKGIPPKLSQKIRRRAFGIKQERTITARGIRFLGIDYGGTNEELQALRKVSGTNKRSFYVDPENLGKISVWDDGKWIEAECSIESFHNIRLVDWIEVGKVLRSRYSAQAELKTSIILAALSDTKKQSTAAQEILGVLPQMHTSEDLERIDRELYWGLSVIDDAPTPVSDLKKSVDGIGYVIGQPRKTSGQFTAQSSSNTTTPQTEPINPAIPSEDAPVFEVQPDKVASENLTQSYDTTNSSGSSSKPWFLEDDADD